MRCSQLRSLKAANSRLGRPNVACLCSEYVSDVLNLQIICVTCHRMDPGSMMCCIQWSSEGGPIGSERRRRRHPSGLFLERLRRLLH